MEVLHILVLRPYNAQTNRKPEASGKRLILTRELKLVQQILNAHHFPRSQSRLHHLPLTHLWKRSTHLTLPIFHQRCHGTNWRHHLAWVHQAASITETPLHHDAETRKLWWGSYKLLRLRSPLASISSKNDTLWGRTNLHTAIAQSRGPRSRFSQELPSAWKETIIDRNKEARRRCLHGGHGSWEHHHHLIQGSRVSPGDCTLCEANPSHEVQRAIASTSSKDVDDEADGDGHPL
jgi:hypothetical protein